MPAPSLFQLARNQLIRSVDNLDDIGDLPYDLMRPVLLKINNPTQLRKLEDTCPQIQGLTGEIWFKLIKQDIPNWENVPHEPKNPKNWWKVYRKLQKEAKAREDFDVERLRQTMAAVTQERKDNQSILPKGYIIPFKGGKKAKRTPSVPSRCIPPRMRGPIPEERIKGVQQVLRREALEAQKALEARKAVEARKDLEAPKPSGSPPTPSKRPAIPIPAQPTLPVYKRKRAVQVLRPNKKRKQQV